MTLLNLFPWWWVLTVFVVPFITAGLNQYMHHLLQHDVTDVYKCILITGMYSYITYVVQQDLMFRRGCVMMEELMQCLRTCHLHCGITIPGVNQRQYKYLCDNSFKLQNFLTVVPITWSTIVNFGITIYMMKPSTDYPIRSIYTIGCIALCGMMTYISDPTIYQNIIPPSKTIINITDSKETTMKVSMGYTIDKHYDKNRVQKMNVQQKYQSYVIVFLNIVTTYLAIVNDNVAQLHSFSNISWMIGCLSDHLKSFQYYTYVAEFMAFMECMKKHCLECRNETSSTYVSPAFTDVTFHNASYGYYDGDLLLDHKYVMKVFNLTFKFKVGIMYYLESPNGIGKSTLLKMFTSNLKEGFITFGDTDRKNMSFLEIFQTIFLGCQASEYTPRFSKDDINAHKSNDLWLEEKLGLSGLFGKDMVEMSGGQKKRMLIYIILTSPASILLLDEILSELSTEDVPEVPEGGGWLTRIINTIIQWPGRKNKLVILVGHGLRNIIPKCEKVIHLCIKNTPKKTVLSMQ